MPSDISRVVQVFPKKASWSGRLAINIAAAALALLAAFLASGDALGQSAPAESSFGGPISPGQDAGIAISAQVSLVWRRETQIMAANTNFNDIRSGEDATNGVVIDTLQKAAIAALTQAAMSGASADADAPAR